MLSGDGPILRLAKWLAAGTALLIALGTPAGHLYLGYQRAGDQMAAEIDLKARQISRLISGNPELWAFEDLRINEFIGESVNQSVVQLQRVTQNNGTVVAQRPPQAPSFFWPTITRTKNLTDYGVAVGQIEIVRSLKPLYTDAMFVTLFSFLAGLAVFWGLRVVPLRLLGKAWDRISYLATHDSLTGLPNRALFLNRLDQAVESARRSKTPVMVLSVDLDRFKDVNDTLGHAAGDLLLKTAADRMKSSLRHGDTLARLGGDEFAILQTGQCDAQIAAGLAERIIAELSRSFDLNGHEVVIGSSIGIALHETGAEASPGQILNNADLALYRSKASGRGTFHFFQEDMDAELRERKALEIDLRKALRNQEFEVHYQPQVDLESQRIVGLEALLRWKHEVRGNVPPSTVIPLAESTGLILPLTEWVLKTACREALAWAPLRVGVNLSPSLFQQRGIVEIVKAALDETGLQPDRLELEITEEVLIADTGRTLEVLTQLKALGVQIAMDDFGTGYSSLSYLRQFPFDKLKIDNSFISDVNNNEDAQTIVRAIISMGHALKMSINAEGVETAEQATVLRAEGCEQVQGYLFGRPMGRGDIDTLLQASGVLTPSELAIAAPALRSA